jgi:hypothetical protein
MAEILSLCRTFLQETDGFILAFIGFAAAAGIVETAAALDHLRKEGFGLSIRRSRNRQHPPKHLFPEDDLEVLQLYLASQAVRRERSFTSWKMWVSWPFCLLQRDLSVCSAKRRYVDADTLPEHVRSFTALVFGS